ncbi:DUF3794 domain-containing protein [Clostridium tarantellae]|uniref:DUF3794 domain-containing protein n=1 Tax=Clostridium tarantellae TaxID=39493 RepID=A0A6I1MI34_9CLOT|nr:DUF3794 domain-containing protein [Clostridium tarantellae]MPQ43216.1 DUF3794 domain-containing protein [Clostridium tarantellae]
MFVFNEDYCCCNEQYNCCNFTGDICCNEYVQSSCCKPVLERTLIKQICESNILALDRCKPDIKEIKESCVKIVINGCKVIENSLGNKIFITGTKTIKIKYFASRGRNCGCILEEVCFTVPFSTCISLPSCNKYTVIDIKAKVLCCEIKKCSCKLISESSLIEICIKLLEKVKDCCNNKCIDNRYLNCKNDNFLNRGIRKMC